MRLKRWLRALAVPAEGMGLIPSTHTMDHNHLALLSQRTWCPRLTSTLTRHTYGKQTYTEIKLSYNKDITLKIKMKKVKTLQFKACNSLEPELCSRQSGTNWHCLACRAREGCPLALHGMQDNYP